MVYIVPAGATATVSEAQVGLTGAAIPTSAALMGVKDQSGNLQPITLTAAGAVPVGIASLPAMVDTNVGLVGASTLRVVEGGRPIATTVLGSNSYSSTNVLTSAYLQLIASMANAVSRIALWNTSGSIIRLATGAAASEVDAVYVGPGGAVVYDVEIAASTRVSIRALDQTASAGYFLFVGLP